MRFTIRSSRDDSSSARLILVGAFSVGSLFALILAVQDMLPDWVAPEIGWSFVRYFARFSLPVLIAYLLGLSPLGMITLPMLSAVTGSLITAESAALVLHSGGRAFLDYSARQGPSVILSLAALFAVAVPAFSCSRMEWMSMLKGGSAPREALSPAILLRLAICCVAAGCAAFLCVVFS